MQFLKPYFFERFVEINHIQEKSTMLPIWTIWVDTVLLTNKFNHFSCNET